MTWCTIQLAKSSGYADHKPPYDFKHGWKPITGQAVADVAKHDKPKSTRPTDDELSKMSEREKTMLSGPLPMDGQGPDGEARYQRRLQAWREKSQAPAPAPEPPTPVVKPKRTKSAPALSSGGSGGTDLQRQALADPEFDSAQLTPEWKSSTRRSRALTPDEQEAVHQWQNGFTEVFADAGEPEVGLYEVLNDMQRNGGRFDLSELDDEDLSNLDLMRTSMESALAKSKTTRDVTVYRGVSQLGDVAVGDTITDPGWQATSYNPQIAQGFMSGAAIGAKKSSSSRMLVVTVPKGKNALAVRERPNLERLFGIKHEIVLGPDTPMRVTKIDGDRVYVEVQ